MSEHPIFIVGSMRSGSTLFRLVLDAHPHIAISEETGFMGGLTAAKEIPGWHHGRDWYTRLGWTEQEVDARLREFYGGMFDRYAAANGKRRWGDKTPFHSRHIAAMARVFPQAVFVAIVRHPGAVVGSLSGRFHYRVPDAAGYWVDTNLEILRCGAELGGSRFALLRYEDLVRRPEPTLRELVAWLGEPWSPDLLRHNDVQAEKGAPRISAGNTRTRDRISSERVDTWAEAMTPHDRDIVVARTGPLAEFLGYDPARPIAPVPIVPANAAGRTLLLTGDQLEERRRRQPGVSFDPSAEAVILPEMDVAELAKRLQRAERALARIRSRRAVRWTNAARRAQQRVAGLPRDLLGVARRALGGRRRRD